MLHNQKRIYRPFLLAASAASPLAIALPASADEPILERDRLLGDWWGFRTDLESHGLDFNGEYVMEYSSVWDGGIRESASFRNILTIDATLDLEQAFGIEGGTAFIQYLSVNPEQGGSLDSGDLQVYSNIENDRHLDAIFELWYEHVLLDGMIRFKIGKVDVNSEFGFVDVAGDFSNSSAGFSPTILGFPSYPDSAMSVNLFVTVIDSPDLELVLGYGYYDGASGVDDIRTGARGPSSFFSTDGSDDSFHVAQLDFAWGGAPDSDERTGRLLIGGWHHTGEFARFDGRTDEGVWGAFLTVEQQVIGAAGGPSLTVFGQLGFSDEDVSEVSHHLAAGVVAGGFPWREDDSAGFYITFAGLSDEPGAGFTDDELALDVYYRMQVTPAVFVQPELQYIVNPSGGGVDDALVGGLRVGVAF